MWSALSPPPPPFFSLWCLGAEVLEGKSLTSHITAGGGLDVLNMALVITVPLCEQFHIEGGKLLPPSGACSSISVICLLLVPWVSIHMLALPAGHLSFLRVLKATFPCEATWCERSC